MGRLHMYVDAKRFQSSQGKYPEGFSLPSVYSSGLYCGVTPYCFNDLKRIFVRSLTDCVEMFRDRCGLYAWFAKV